MNAIQVFNNPAFGEVRTIKSGDEILFCGKDVAVALGYKDPTNAMKQHCKGVAKHHPLQTPGGTQQVRFISEPDMYRLVANSKLPNAQQFEAWVFEEVLPSIRKQGMYATPGTIEKMISDPDTMITLLLNLKDEQQKRKALEQQTKELQAENSSMKESCKRYMQLTNTKSVLSTTEIAKQYGMSAVVFNRLLKEYDVQYSCNGAWILKQPYADKAYVDYKQFPITRKDNTLIYRNVMYWTQRGREFLYYFLKHKGHVPIIEQQPLPDQPVLMQ